MLSNARRFSALTTRTRGQPHRHGSRFWGSPPGPRDTSQLVDLSELSGGTIRAIREDEMQVVEERQLRHSASALVGVPAVSKCQHGFPQAALSNPVGHSTAAGWKPVSGICRLTCPYLVKALDAYEAEGAVAAFNVRLQGGAATAEGRAWPAALASANQAHRALRRALMPDAAVARVQAVLGAANEDAFMQAGVAGMSPTKLDDVKCLHAQLGDYLLRGGNAVGEAVAQDLARRGTSLGGSADCRQQCDVAVPEVEDGWRYMSVKNNSKLRTQVQRRVASKALQKLSSNRPPRARGLV